MLYAETAQIGDPVRTRGRVAGAVALSNHLLRCSKAPPVPTRDDLLRDLSRALNRCFPDRAEILIAEIERRLR